MSKGTVLYVGGFELPDKNAAAHRVLNNAKILKAIGFNVVFLGVEKGGEHDGLIQKENVQGFECWSIARKSKVDEIKYYFSIKNFKKTVNKLKDVQFVICYNYQAVALYKVWRYCKKRNIKVLSDCTEWFISVKKLINLDTTLRMEHIQKKIDGVICISRYLENYYNKFTKTICLPPLVDKDEEKWACQSIAFEPGMNHFVYSGTPGRRKDKINVVISALSGVTNNFRLHIVGITEQQFLASYPEEAEHLKTLGAKVEFLGRIAHLESCRYIKSADFVVFIREKSITNDAGFPTKYVESSSSGVPVVTTDTSDLNRYIKDGINGFILDGRDEQSVRQTLENILRLSEDEVMVIKQYCEKHNDDFDYRKYIAKTQDFFCSFEGSVC